MERMNNPVDSNGMSAAHSNVSLTQNEKCDLCCENCCSSLRHGICTICCCGSKNWKRSLVIWLLILICVLSVTNGLFMRLVAFDSRVYSRTSGDVFLLGKSVSTLYCSDMDIRGELPINVNRYTEDPTIYNRYIFEQQNITSTKAIYNWGQALTWQFYLIDGSSMRFDLCTFDETTMDVKIFQGASNYNKWLRNRDCMDCSITLMTTLERQCGSSQSPQSVYFFADTMDEYYLVLVSRYLIQTTLELNVNLTRVVFRPDYSTIYECTTPEDTNRCMVQLEVGDLASFIAISIPQGNGYSTGNVYVKCLPRTWVYMVFNVAIPAMVCLVIVLTFVCCCRRSKKFAKSLDRQALVGHPGHNYGSNNPCPHCNSGQAHTNQVFQVPISTDLQPTNKTMPKV